MMDQAKDPLSAFRLDGRAAAITGGASGIGKATAEILAAAGASVVVGDLDEAGADAVAKGINETGGRAIAQKIDISKRADLDALVDRAVSEFGRLDAMANVAGIAADGLIAEATEQQLDKAIAVNLKGVFFGCQAAMRVMMPQGSGSIINVSSTAIDAPAARYGLYAMTKAAVAMLTKTLALEAGRYGIRVNALAPGSTITSFTLRHLHGAGGEVDQSKYDAFVDRMKKQSPLGMLGEPEDQGYLILYLASDAARWCTGQVWRANGGQAFGA
jgi:3-oxoacyl-[acyl-carrier protein] reductase